MARPAVVSSVHLFAEGPCRFIQRRILADEGGLYCVSRRRSIRPIGVSTVLLPFFLPRVRRTNEAVAILCPFTYDFFFSNLPQVVGWKSSRESVLISLKENRITCGSRDTFSSFFFFPSIPVENSVMRFF